MPLTTLHGESCRAAQCVRGRTDAVCGQTGGHVDHDDEMVFHHMGLADRHSKKPHCIRWPMRPSLSSSH
eukprot:3853212-Karenia_brevis.AAC.1